MSYFDPTAWRTFTPEEMRAFLNGLTQRLSGEKRKENVEKRKEILILQKSMSPFDVYTYLYARFGSPNGFMTFLARDDSDNLFHWDYQLKAGEKDLIFTGATQEVRVLFDGYLSDTDYLRFIDNLKKDFARVGKAKGEFSATLEKWNIFPNQYLAIADRCAELYSSIETALPKLNRTIAAGDFNPRTRLLLEKGKKLSRLITQVTTASTELSVLMPVMFESFIGLLVAGLTKPEVKKNKRMFDSFVRSPLDVKIFDLAHRCNGFERAIEQNNPAFARYWTVVNKRNDIIHGNIDPVRDSLEVVYFHGKRPLYKSGGDRIQQHWMGLIRQYKPQEVLDDYIAMHEFILEILDHLKPNARESFWVVMGDRQPGWDDKRGIFGRLFSDNVITTYNEDVRYDWEFQSK